jgi:hypothetical protein
MKFFPPAIQLFFDQTGPDLKRLNPPFCQGKLGLIPLWVFLFPERFGGFPQLVQGGVNLPFRFG